MKFSADRHAITHCIRKASRLMLFILLIITGACNGVKSENENVQSFVIDPVFKEYFESLGGENIFGPVISPAFVVSDIKYQYVVGALLQNNPLAQEGQQITFSPIGRDLNIDEHIEFVEGQISGPFLRDLIYPEFLQVYQYLGGMQVVGRPLTGLHYNPEFQRYEQYFENLGFYRLENDTPGAVHLLAYGAWKCDTKCPAKQKQEAAIIIKNKIDPIFVTAVKQLGYGFTGFALSGGYQSDDGGYEQVFENVLLRVDTNQPNRVTLSSLPQKLEMQAEPFESVTGDPSRQFISINGDEGYNVPTEFMEYLNEHGGLTIAGNPIGTYYQHKESIYRQCFENLCLEVETSIDGLYRVRPVPLGYPYLGKLGIDFKGGTPQPDGPERNNTQPASNPVENITGDVNLQVWENNPFVTSDQSQVIGVMVYENNKPLANMTPELTITLPDGRQKDFTLPETDGGGKSQIQLEPTGAPNGTLIPYQVCVTKSEGETFCVKDNFLIWNNP